MDRKRLSVRLKKERGSDGKRRWRTETVKRAFGNDGCVRAISASVCV